MFSEKLKELRLKANMTQEDLAQKLFVTRNAVSKWETNKGYPSIDTLNEIAQLFQVTLDDLIHDKDAKMIALENAKTINHQKNIFKAVIIFLLYSLFGTLFPFALVTYDPTSIMTYFLVFAPISYLFLALISCFICRKKTYVVISSLLGILPIYLFFDLYTNISLNYYEIIYWILFIVSYLLLLKITNMDYSYKALKILKIIFFVLFILFLLLFFVLLIVSFYHYNHTYSAPWYATLMIYSLIFLLPISLTFILYVFYSKKEKVKASYNKERNV